MCEDSLNVPSAKTAGERFGRSASISTLTGQRILTDSLPIGSTINKRVISFKPPKKLRKQTGRTCGWPSTPEARAIFELAGISTEWCRMYFATSKANLREGLGRVRNTYRREEMCVGEYVACVYGKRATR